MTAFDCDMNKSPRLVRVAPRMRVEGWRALPLFVWHALVTWQSRIEQRARLAELDSRMRRDMGLSDAEIDAEVRKPFWRE